VEKSRHNFEDYLFATHNICIQLTNNTTNGYMLS